MSSKWIVITTINPPTPAIERISALVQASGWRCIVVGDRKTRSPWCAEGIDFLSYADQEAAYGELSRLLPANHYCRKNLGYLYAAERGAEVILETDDDNIPGDDFAAAPSLEVMSEPVGGARWINIYRYFSDALIWPRGNPLNTIHDVGSIVGTASSQPAPIQQFLADGDPDVDAIYRLLFKDPVYFARRQPVSLAMGSWCSFNSQNTLFYREAFPLLYLPCHVSFRMTDIWRSFVAQAALWSMGRRLVFRPATVVQVRNQHDLMKDFTDEVDGYLMNDRIALVLEQLLGQIGEVGFAEFASAAWKRLQTEDVVRSEELQIQRAWAEHLERVT